MNQIEIVTFLFFMFFCRGIEVVVLLLSCGSKEQVNQKGQKAKTMFKQNKYLRRIPNNHHHCSSLIDNNSTQLTVVLER